MFHVTGRRFQWGPGTMFCYSANGNSSSWWQKAITRELQSLRIFWRVFGRHSLSYATSRGGMDARLAANVPLRGSGAAENELLMSPRAAQRLISPQVGQDWCCGAASSLTEGRYQTWGDPQRSIHYTRSNSQFLKWPPQHIHPCSSVSSWSNTECLSDVKMFISGGIDRSKQKFWERLNNDNVSFLAVENCCVQVVKFCGTGVQGWRGPKRRGVDLWKWLGVPIANAELTWYSFR